MAKNPFSTWAAGPQQRQQNQFNLGVGQQAPFSLGGQLPPIPQYPQQQLPQQQANPFAMLMAPQEQQQQQNFVPENLAALRNDPQGDKNRSYVPGLMNESNPFSNGTFLGHDQRAAREQQVLGQPGITGASPEQRMQHMQQTQFQAGQAGLGNPYSNAGSVVPPLFMNPTMYPQSNPNQLSAFEASHGMQNGASPSTASINPWGIGWATTNQPQPGQNVIGDESGPRFNQPGQTPKRKQIPSPFGSY